MITEQYQAINFSVSRKTVVTAVHGTSLLFAVEGPAEDSEKEML